MPHLSSVEVNGIGVGEHDSCATCDRTHSFVPDMGGRKRGGTMPRCMLFDEGRKMLMIYGCECCYVVGEHP